MNFAETLKMLREARDVTQAQLAAYLKVSRPTIAGYETKNHQPDYEKLVKIAEFFEVTVDFLLTGNNTDRTNPLDREIQIACASLSASKKQDVLRYIKYLKAEN